MHGEVLYFLARVLGFLPRDSLPWKLLILLMFGLSLVAFIADALWFTGGEEQNALLQLVLWTTQVAQYILTIGLGVGTAFRKGPLQRGLLPPAPRVPVRSPEAIMLGTVLLEMVIAVGYMVRVGASFILPVLTTVIAVFILSLESFLFYAAVRGAENSFRAVNGKLRGVEAAILSREKAPMSCLGGVIAGLRAAHLAATRSLAAISEAFGLQLAAMLMHNFLVITTNLFISVLGFVHGGGVMVVGHIHLAICFIAHTTVTALVADLPAAKANEAIKIVCDILNGSRTTTLEVEQLKLFLMQASTSEPRVRVLHMFTLCPSEVILPVAQTIATYLVILVQFQMAFPSALPSYFMISEE